MNVSVPAALWTGSSGQTLLQKTIRRNQHCDWRTILMGRLVVSFTRQTFSVKISAKLKPPGTDRTDVYLVSNAQRLLHAI